MWEEDERWQRLLGQLLPELATAVRQAADLAAVQEIRLRTGWPVRLRLLDRELTLDLIWRREQQEQQLMLFLDNSVYAFEEQLRQGFVTLAGGHRVGLVGQAWYADGRLGGFRDICSQNIRIARELPGVAKPLLPYIICRGRVLRTLLAAPPGVGKTTLLRDLVRMLADGEAGISPLNVGVADERMELAAVFNGQAQLNVGSRCDVISGCEKASAVQILLRVMGPQVVVTDEIGSREDAAALAEALNAGVSVLASAHAADYDELLGRPWLGDLLRQGFFERVIFPRRKGGVLLPAVVYDADGVRLK
ncbi:MAG: stage III sporulation protein AA [Firmicutes bacterium]|nr:stage III sporulation protein AA [Bacillota bacterium]